MNQTAAIDTTSNTSNSEIRNQHDQFLAPNYAPMAIVPDRGEGVRLWDIEGNEYLDFGAGIAVSALGHANPELQKVLRKQAARFWHVSNLMTNDQAIGLAQRLCTHTFAEKVFFGNSGGEANEAALKLARRFAVDHYGEEKNEIIAFDNAFHGRTFFTVCVGGQTKYSDGFGPKPAGITHLPFNDLEALTQHISDKTCAVMLEPVQGEGGVNPATPEFLRHIRQLCDKHNALLIFDEIQTGVGRSGALYVYQKVDVTPDILTTAKGLGGGFPIGAMLTTDKIAASLKVGTHGSTFGGNPMACAVANRILDMICESDMLESIEEKSQRIVSGLNAINDQYGIFKEVRGYGLLLGCELSESWQDRSRDVLNACMAQGLLVLVAGPNVIRLAPALNIENHEIDEGLEKIAKAIAGLTGES